MSRYLAFVKKEVTENIRTYKVLILLAVFLAFGMMSPLTAKLTPEILKNFAIEGMEIKMLNPSAIDSYMQFFKNVTSIGLIVLVLIFSSTLTGEITKGTLINILTKGLTRNTVILAKFTVSSLLWTISLLLCLGTTYGYTVYLFVSDSIYHLWYSVFCLWIFGIFLLSLLMFTSTLCSSSYGPLIGTGAAVVFLNIINILPGVSSYNPLTLISDNIGMLSKEYEISTAFAPLGVTIAACFIFIALAIGIFRKKKL